MGVHLSRSPLFDLTTALLLFLSVALQWYDRIDLSLERAREEYNKDSFLLSEEPSNEDLLNFLSTRKVPLQATYTVRKVDDVLFHPTLIARIALFAF